MLFLSLGDVDFNATSTEYSITGMGSVTAPVGIINDVIAEEEEDFFGNLGFGGGLTFSNIRLEPARAEATIIDEDGNFFYKNELFCTIQSTESLQRRYILATRNIHK